MQHCMHRIACTLPPPPSPVRFQRASLSFCATMAAAKEAAGELLHHALTLLAGRPHSTSELRRKLCTLCLRRQRFGKRACACRDFRTTPRRCPPRTRALGRWRRAPLRTCTSTSATAAGKYRELDCSSVVEGVVATLAEAGGEPGAAQGVLLNDAAYAEWHVAQRASHKPRSLLQLRAELAAKGVAGKAAAEALAEYDEGDAAFRAALKELHSAFPTGDALDGTLPQAAVQDVTKKLSGRGYPRDVLAAAVDRAHAELRQAAQPEPR